MNNGLYRVHKVIFAIYITLAVFLALIAGSSLLGDHPDGSIIVVGVVLLPIAFLHWCAARGAKLGQRWGRTTSRIIAVLMIFGFPIGTLIAIYIFSQTGKKWQMHVDTPAAAAPLT